MASSEGSDHWGSVYFLPIPPTAEYHCYPLLFLPSVFSASGSFPMSQFFTSGGQSIGVSPAGMDF